VLFDVFSRMGFPAVLGPFLHSYLVGQRTMYKWDSFTSDPFAADVGVGQGSAMSPMLLALYLMLIMRRFRASDISHRVNLMSYVDDGTIIAQSRRVEDNLPLLKEAYGWLFRAFESLGLVLEHDKSEVFHFSRARSFVGPAIDLRYAPYTGTTPLRPKPVWRYLGFFFDRKLQFKEHACFYMTRVFTQVRAMGMLGNSVRGLEPNQKRLLYRSCMVPVIMYGFRLWYFKGARVKGLIKAMSQVQHTAVRWICGNFRTTLGGGAECLSGLLPMHLTLCRLADRGATRMPLLARSHPLRTILGEAMEGCHQAHPLALANSGPLSATSLQGAAVDMAVGASVLRQDEYDPFGPDSQPGNRVVDLFQLRFHRHGPTLKKDEDIVKYKDQLDLAWAEAYVDKSCCVVAADTSMPTGGIFQVAAAALVYRQGDVVSHVVSAAGRHTPPPPRSSALRYSWASLRPWPKDARSWLSSRTPSLWWSPCSVSSFGRGRYSPWTAVVLWAPGLLGTQSALFTSGSCPPAWSGARRRLLTTLLCLSRLPWAGTHRHLAIFCVNGQTLRPRRTGVSCSRTPHTADIASWI
jgi:hypothetical protein